MFLEHSLSSKSTKNIQKLETVLWRGRQWRWSPQSFPTVLPCWIRIYGAFGNAPSVKNLVFGFQWITCWWDHNLSRFVGNTASWIKSFFYSRTPPANIRKPVEIHGPRACSVEMVGWESPGRTLDALANPRFTTVEFNDWGLFSEYLGPILQNKCHAQFLRCSVGNSVVFVQCKWVAPKLFGCDMAIHFYIHMIDFSTDLISHGNPQLAVFYRHMLNIVQ